MAFSHEGWTYGAEHELADIDRRKPLPAGYKWDDRDVTIVNSNGIANDPKGRLYGYGGEINTPATNSISGQMGCLLQILEWDLSARVNYRSNLHLHIRVPGLKEDLRALKRLALYNAHWLPIVLPIIEPIPYPNGDDYGTELSWQGALRRYKRRKRSHQTVLTPQRTAKMIEAHTVEEFFRAEVPVDSKGNPMWHAQARAAVNIRQLRETETIEFRHFSGTLDINELSHCFDWCEHYLLCALCPTWGLRPSALDPYQTFKPHKPFQGVLAGFPEFPPYDHALEIRYRATCHDGSLEQEQIARNIKAIEENSFDDEAWERSLKW